MHFAKRLAPCREDILRSLGYGSGGAPLPPGFERALDEISTAAAPRWVWRRFPLDDACHLGDTGLQLHGGDIAAHLAGCGAALLLAVTLGRGPDEAIRRAAATDVGHSVLLDSAASTLAEQYAELAEETLRSEAAQGGEYLTGRFSPGYGDFPLGAQETLLRLLDAPRAIGLTAVEGGLMLPCKSITAVLGVADHPVQGLRPGCAHCSMAASCRMKNTKQ